MKVCLGESISETDKITALLESLQDEYAVEVEKINSEDVDHLEDVLPALFAAEIASNKLSFSTTSARTTHKTCANHPHARDHTTEECSATRRQNQRG